MSASSSNSKGTEEQYQLDIEASRILTDSLKKLKEDEVGEEIVFGGVILRNGKVVEESEIAPSLIGSSGAEEGKNGSGDQVVEVGSLPDDEKAESGQVVEVGSQPDDEKAESEAFDDDENEDEDPEYQSDFDMEEKPTNENEGSGFNEEVCYCRQPKDLTSALGLMSSLCEEDFNSTKISCDIDNVVRCVNLVLEKTIEEVISIEKIAFIDLFYRYRHEVMFYLLTCAFRLPNVKSDISFRNFGVDSDRTPDLIHEIDNVTYIIEVGVVGNMERGAQSKGAEEFGFEGKYQKEVNIMVDMGKSVKYYPILFNMSDTETPYSIDQMNSLASAFPKSKSFYTMMISKARVFSMISQDIKQFFVLSSTLLFSKMVKVPDSHSSHEFLYEKSSLRNINYDYKELVISPYVFKKVDNNWSRFEEMIIRKDIPDHAHIQFRLNLLTHRFSVEKVMSGVPSSLMLKIIQQNDKVSFLESLLLTTNYGSYKATDNEKGVKFFIKNDKKIKGSKPKEEKSVNFEVNTFQSHKPTLVSCPFFNLNAYKKFVDSEEGIFYNFKYFDNNYEDLLVAKIMEFDKAGGIGKLDRSKFLGLKNSGDIDIDGVMSQVITNYESLNAPNDSMPTKVLKMKQPFVLPIAAVNSMCYTKLDFKNIEFYNAIKESLKDSDQFTNKVIDGVLDPSFVLFMKSKAPSSTYRDLVSSRMRVSNEIGMLQKELYRKTEPTGVTRLSKTTDPIFRDRYIELRKKYNEANKLVNQRAAMERVKEKQGFIRLPSKGKGVLASDFKKEMSHFKVKNVQSTYEGVGIRDSVETDYEKDKLIFNSINNRLTTYAGENSDLLIDNYVSPDAKLLEDLKRIALNEFMGLLNQVKNSQLGHSSAFISRLCHCLMYLSQQPFNSDYIKVDNLGYDNVLLIVRGGKKIFKSKSSKLFRLVIPLAPELVPWYTEGRSNKGSINIFNFKGSPYLLTPWSMLHESILTDGISFYPRICSFVVLNLNNKLKLEDQYDKVSVNVMLAFHNRRQTEVLLANMRYILLSTMGDFTGIEDILQEFFGFNYDCFQSFIRNSIALNYSSYFKTLLGIKNKKTQGDITVSDFKSCFLKNIFTEMAIQNVEDLALMIYSTFLMTKAPYQRSVERANNLKGILKIHQLYDKEVGLSKCPEEQYNSLNISLEDKTYAGYIDELFNNDFNIDGKFCSLVGNFINSEFNSRGLKDDLHNKWYSILGSSWDEMATSTGLRGNYEQVELFWGQKGYFVVYKDLISDPLFVGQLQELFFSNSSDDDKRKTLKKINRCFIDRLDQDREFLIFHAVDKVQWKGGREIYVMDIDTKLLQQPIEKYMGYLCKLLDNELISIPSDKRSQVIHHAIFEKDLPLKETLTWYLTLDCTKWAPKSVFMKFIITFLCMDCLPNSFKKHFMNYSEKLFYKRIYFNKQEVEVLKNNPAYSSICEEFLNEDKKVNGYYLNMPYSWVMGIFNYTSSFLHAANQKYLSYIIMKTSVLSYQEETSLFMFAHSDDSGGRLTAGSKELAQRALVIYEVGLKACNHLLSKKKSVVSRIYFEILSIIYLFKKLLALLPKFLGGLRFLPTDKGACQDMSQSYSKCIEVLVAGANFSIAYIVLKLYSMMVWRFYYNQSPTKLDYDRPVQYMGLPDSHPLMVLLCGSDADILRIFYKNKCTLKRVMAFSEELISTTEEPGPIKPYKFEIKVKNVKKGFEGMIEAFSETLQSWSLRNVNYHNTALNLLNFLNKLRDSGFVGSLVNESTVRRFSRGFFMKNNAVIMSKLGNLKIDDLLNGLRLYQGFSDENEAIRMVLSEVLSEDQISQINQSIEEGDYKMEINLKVLQETLQSPLKVYKFMDQLSMEGRKINYQPRTLKPTVVQLVKSTPVFSSHFDPTCLVSYIKEENYRWALPDIRGIFTSDLELRSLLIRRGLDIDKIEPDNLLRICRDFGPNSTKTIYLYSRVPSELRQVKSYSAFLTFLSVNSFDNHEITGLTLRLNPAEMSTEYTKGNVNEDIYMLATALSSICVLYSKVDFDFFCSLTIKQIDELEFNGGTISDLIDHVENRFANDVNYSFFQPYFMYLSCIAKSTSSVASDLNKGAFYTFVKSQKLRSGWYGKGEIYINIEHKFFSFTLFNNTITGVVTNFVGKLLQHHSDYIMDVLNHNGLTIHDLPKIPSLKRGGLEDFFGFDYSGHLASSCGRELVTGVTCTVKSHRGGYVDELYSYNIIALNNNVITIRCDVFDKVTTHKLFALPLRKGEIINTYMRLLKKEEFESKLNSEGLDSFEDFIYTELLTEYGGETYVEFDKLMDNFAASKLFQIFSECRRSSISMIPKNPNFSNYPANEGSLTRILIDYGETTNKPIIAINRDLNPTLMQVRSEYPEQMSVILKENLVISFDKLFDKTEIREISDDYHTLAESDDKELVRASLIKLMTYWGYGSFVNSIQCFSLKRTPDNYGFFNLVGLLHDRSNIYSELFVFLMNSIIKEMLDWSEQYPVLPFQNPRLKNRLGVTGLCQNFVKYISVSCYQYVLLDRLPDINSVQFNAALLLFLQDEDFCSSLQNSLSKHYVLGSIPISYSVRKDLIISINTLRHIWCTVNKVSYEPKSNLKNDRLADGIPNWKAISKVFNIPTPPIWALYNGAINHTTVEEIVKRVNCSYRTRFGVYHLSGGLKAHSTVKVKCCPEWIPTRPIKQSVLESDAWEDQQCEFDFGEVDMDTVNDYNEEIGKLYVQKSTKITGWGANKKIFANISVIINTMQSCKSSKIFNFRQCGENLMIISTSHMESIKDYLYNARVRVIQFSQGEVLYVYTSFQNELNNDELIDKMLGSVRHYLLENDIKDSFVSMLRERDGQIKESTDIGTFFDEGIMSGDLVFKREDDNLVLKNLDEMNKADEPKIVEREETDKAFHVLSKIEDLKLQGLSEKACGKLKEKYIRLTKDYKIKLSLAMRSLTTESDLSRLLEDLESQNFRLTSDQYKNVFMSPKHFGATHGMSHYGSKNIKDKNVKAEIESLNLELSNKVGSGVCNLSHGFQKVVKANLKMWTNLIKGTQHKRENKSFAIVFFTTLLSCCKISDNTDDDGIWQSCLNKMSLYITDEPDSDDDEDDMMSLIEGIKSLSRIKYQPKGT